MKLLPTLRPLAFVFAAFLPSVVLAHPGHDGDHGGGLTWDFAGSVVHRLTSPYHLLPVVAAAAGVLGLFVWLRGRDRAKAARTKPTRADRRA